MTKGDRVQASQKAKANNMWGNHGRDPSVNERRGVLLGYVRSNGCVTVMWDHRKNSESVHSSFLEVIQKSALDFPSSLESIDWESLVKLADTI